MHIARILTLSILGAPSMTFTVRPISSRTTITTNHSRENSETIAAAGTMLGGSITQASREQIRQRRLAALGQTDAALAETTESQRSNEHPPVIDLCESEHDDDENQQKPAALQGNSDDDDSVNLVDYFSHQPSQRISSSLEAPSDRSTSMKREKSNSSPSNTASRKRPSTALMSTSSVPQQSLQIATYNLWFQPVHPTERMKAFSHILLQCHRPNNPLAMIAFQEVVPSLASVLFPSLERQGYTILRQPTESVPYGCAMAIRTDTASIIQSGFRPFTDTIMGRGILYARVRLPTAQEVLFTTTHLESWAGENYAGSTERQTQILEMESFCVEMVSNYPNVQCAVITGDLNWDDERARSTGPDPVLLEHLKNRWVDVWKHLHGADKKAIGYTYDAKINPMLGGNLRRRFDRILLYPDNSWCQVQSTDLLGKDALPGLSWSKTNPYNNTVRSVPVAPSDHFGLLAQLCFESNS